jgi:hypothetical protein
MEPKKTPMDYAKKVWGSGQSRGFKVAAWGAAIAAAVAINHFQNK